MTNAWWRGRGPVWELGVSLGGERCCVWGLGRELETGTECEGSCCVTKVAGPCCNSAAWDVLRFWDT